MWILPKVFVSARSTTDDLMTFADLGSFIYKEERLTERVALVS